jgi:hypothetical protein
MTRTACARCAWPLRCWPACASGPPTPDWQHGCARRAGSGGGGRSARRQPHRQALEFDRARAEIARTGRPDLLARAELLRCATQRGQPGNWNPAPVSRRCAPMPHPQNGPMPTTCWASWTGAQHGAAARRPSRPPGGRLAPSTTVSAADAALQAAMADPVSRLVAAGGAGCRPGRAIQR